MNQKQNRISDAIVGALASTLVIAGIWWWTNVSSSYLVPPLGDIFSQFRETWLSNNVTTDLLPTLQRVALGYCLAVTIGIIVGLLVGLNPVFHELTHPLISFQRSIPPVALLPAAMVILGIGDNMRISLIAFVCVWPILLNISDGLRELDRTMLDAARAFRISGLRRLRHVLLPALGPRAFAGMRTSLSLAIIMGITSEMVAATNGVGTFLVRAQQAFQITQMWAAIILVGLLGFLLNFIFGLLERRVLRWHSSAEQQ